MSSVNKICTCIYVSSCSNQQQWFTLKFIACACFINQLWLSKLSLPLRCNTSTYSYLLQKQKMHCLWEVQITDHKNKDNHKELFFFAFFFLQCSLYIQQNVEVDNDCYPNPVMLTHSVCLCFQLKQKEGKVHFDVHSGSRVISVAFLLYNLFYCCSSLFSSLYTCYRQLSFVTF